ncbi:hypothetical protein D9756_008528 [Leucocoprinus leucothites]|uniref:glutathione transferase n=1 Tax=Leucocoprinus leucothites TaxID=201217 RepID=A0A8H5CZ50_9AGAR|nr:hypothetical protein D9756_008528 [Leucoagaricus leucothites]
MVLKLYGYTRSPPPPPTKLVTLVLYEKNVPFEYIEVDILKGEQRDPGFLSTQPYGQVPVMNDNGFVLYESRAIIRYIADKYADQGTSLAPKDLQKRALLDQAAWGEAFNFNHHASPKVASELLYKKFLGQETDLVKVEELKKSLSAKLDIYEQILSKQAYLIGDELTLADLQHIPFGTLLEQAQVNLTQERPNTARWFNEISSRASWQKVKDGLPARA